MIIKELMSNSQLGPVDNQYVNWCRMFASFKIALNKIFLRLMASNFSYYPNIQVGTFKSPVDVVLFV